MNKLNNLSRVLFAKKILNFNKQSACGLKIITEQRNTSAKHSAKQKGVSDRL